MSWETSASRPCRHPERVAFLIRSSTERADSELAGSLSSHQPSLLSSDSAASEGGSAAPRAFAPRSVVRVSSPLSAESPKNDVSSAFSAVPANLSPFVCNPDARRGVSSSSASQSLRDPASASGAGFARREGTSLRFPQSFDEERECRRDGERITPPRRARAQESLPVADSPHLSANPCHFSPQPPAAAFVSSPLFSSPHSPAEALPYDARDEAQSSCTPSGERGETDEDEGVEWPSGGLARARQDGAAKEGLRVEFSSFASSSTGCLHSGRQETCFLSPPGEEGEDEPCDYSDVSRESSLEAGGSEREEREKFHSLSPRPADSAAWARPGARAFARPAAQFPREGCDSLLLSCVSSTARDDDAREDRVYRGEVRCDLASGTQSERDEEVSDRRCILPADQPFTLASFSSFSASSAAEGYPSPAPRDPLGRRRRTGGAPWAATSLQRRGGSREEADSHDPEEIRSVSSVSSRRGAGREEHEEDERRRSVEQEAWKATQAPSELWCEASREASQSPLVAQGPRRAREKEETVSALREKREGRRRRRTRARRRAARLRRLSGAERSRATTRAGAASTSAAGSHPCETRTNSRPSGAGLGPERPPREKRHREDGSRLQRHPKHVKGGGCGGPSPARVVTVEDGPVTVSSRERVQLTAAPEAPFRRDARVLSPLYPLYQPFSVAAPSHPPPALPSPFLSSDSSSGLPASSREASWAPAAGVHASAAFDLTSAGSESRLFASSASRVPTTTSAYYGGLAPSSAAAVDPFAPSLASGGCPSYAYAPAGVPASSPVSPPGSSFYPSPFSCLSASSPTLPQFVSGSLGTAPPLTHPAETPGALASLSLWSYGPVGPKRGSDSGAPSGLLPAFLASSAVASAAAHSSPLGAAPVFSGPPAARDSEAFGCFLSHANKVAAPFAVFASDEESLRFARYCFWSLRKRAEAQRARARERSISHSSRRRRSRKRADLFSSASSQRSSSARPEEISADARDGAERGSPRRRRSRVVLSGREKSGAGEAFELACGQRRSSPAEEPPFSWTQSAPGACGERARRDAGSRDARPFQSRRRRGGEQERRRRSPSALTPYPYSLVPPSLFSCASFSPYSSLSSSLLGLVPPVYAVDRLPPLFAQAHNRPGWSKRRCRREGDSWERAMSHASSSVSRRASPDRRKRRQGWGDSRREEHSRSYSRQEGGDRRSRRRRSDASSSSRAASSSREREEEAEEEGNRRTRSGREGDRPDEAREKRRYPSSRNHVVSNAERASSPPSNSSLKQPQCRLDASLPAATDSPDAAPDRAQSFDAGKTRNGDASPHTRGASRGDAREGDKKRSRVDASRGGDAERRKTRARQGWCIEGERHAPPRRPDCSDSRAGRDRETEENLAEACDAARLSDSSRGEDAKTERAEEGRSSPRKWETTARLRASSSHRGEDQSRREPRESELKSSRRRRLENTGTDDATSSSRRARASGAGEEGRMKSERRGGGSRRRVDRGGGSLASPPRGSRLSRRAGATRSGGRASRDSEARRRKRDDSSRARTKRRKDDRRASRASRPPAKRRKEEERSRRDGERRRRSSSRSVSGDRRERGRDGRDAGGRGGGRKKSCLSRASSSSSRSSSRPHHRSRRHASSPSYRRSGYDYFGGRRERRDRGAGGTREEERRRGKARRVGCCGGDGSSREKKRDRSRTSCHRTSRSRERVGGRDGRRGRRYYGEEEASRHRCPLSSPYVSQHVFCPVSPHSLFYASRKSSHLAVPRHRPEIAPPRAYKSSKHQPYNEGWGGERSRRKSREKKRDRQEEEARGERRRRRAAKGATRRRDEGGERRRAAAKKKEKKDESSKDDIVHFDWRPGMWLTDRYRVLDKMGEGTFGRVLRCADVHTQREVAIKVVRDVSRYTSAARIEVDILREINERDAPSSSSSSGSSSSSHCVRLHDAFLYKSRHMCLVFEKLGKSLYDLLTENHYLGFYLEDIRIVAKQCLIALAFLRACRLTHTDLKPENILLLDDILIPVPAPRPSGSVKGHYLRPAQVGVKIIDFGSATFEDDYHSSLINTRQYRAPEVILGLGWDMSSDVWSLGCILMELYTGNLLFRTHEHLEHLAMMERIVGPFPTEMLESALSTDGRRYVAPPAGEGASGPPPAFDAPPGVEEEREKKEREKRDSGTLPPPRLHWPEGASSANSEERVRSCVPLQALVLPQHRIFSDFVRSLLQIDPQKRPTPGGALMHPFFTAELRE
ncbi:hypothetical protein BESB_062140 [Besnoitia besnoiti]|uniref:Protein kinase domain-containing protein n=1 Tax=Besnoitia besnoiti TaxID=94643 RepID=A0A2A9MIA7_BESBE|nr:hypothetical protein BESB_062140 [Besnoitia besnoiti]PFH35327.1 hypothetical protein BESB_062140 [Besnoitia besnoiti]